MRKNSSKVIAKVALLGLLLTVGCSGDVTKMLSSNPELQSQIMGAISNNPDLANRMIDQLLASEGARTLVLDKVMANGQTMQSLMATMARDQTMVDGVINFAVQDSIMRDHVLTLFKGMQMAKGTR